MPNSGPSRLCILQKLPGNPIFFLPALVRYWPLWPLRWQVILKKDTLVFFHTVKVFGKFHVIRVKTFGYTALIRVTDKDRQADRHTDRHTERQTNTQGNESENELSHQTDKQANRQTDRQTDRRESDNEFSRHVWWTVRLPVRWNSKRVAEGWRDD